MRLVAFLLLLCPILMPAAVVQAAGPAPVQDAASRSGGGVILADPAGPYYPLAEEMAQSEGLPIAHSLDEVLARDPAFLLWVVSPGRLSDEVLVEFGQAMRDREGVIAAGIISGLTLEDARNLWLRAPEVRGERAVAANAANPSGQIEAGIRSFDKGQSTSLPLTRANLLDQLQQADYLTFTGHGGKSYLRLDEDTALRPADIPALPPLVIATGSCNTFRPWEENSIPLAFARQGAAAYAGFAYSPNEGFLIGEFEGLPFRFTWPDFSIGHVVQVENQGTLQGFAQFPYYYLLGDPRIALQAAAPCRLVGDRASGDRRTLTYAGAPEGMVPVRIPGGAGYSFVEIPGVGAAWDRDPFYNSRLQMVSSGDDRFLLFEHGGGDFSLHLRARPPWYWVPADLVADALDTTLLFHQGGGGAIIFLAAGLLALAAVAWLLVRKKASPRTLVPAALAGLGFAALHGLYALARLEKLSTTSKTVQFEPVGLLATFLLVGCGACLFLNARWWWGRAIAIAVASFGALAPTVLSLGIVALSNVVVAKAGLGMGLWNYSLGLQPLIVLALECMLFVLVFAVLRRKFAKREAATI